MRGMVRRLTAALLVVPLTGVAVAGSAKAQLLRLEQIWLKAAQERDIAVLRRVLSDDYIDISYKGAIRNKADALRAPVVNVNEYVQQVGNEEVRRFGETAIVTGRGVLSRRNGSRVAAWRFTDVFVKQAGGWRAVSSQETLEQR